MTHNHPHAYRLLLLDGTPASTYLLDGPNGDRGEAVTYQWWEVDCALRTLLRFGVKAVAEKINREERSVA